MKLNAKRLTKSYTNGLLCVTPKNRELSRMTEYTGEGSLPGACTLQPVVGDRISQNDTTLCLAVPAAMCAADPPPQDTE